jgi:hypothetical protein
MPSTSISILSFRLIVCLIILILVWIILILVVGHWSSGLRDWRK